jgi:hypothetical protein
MKLLPALPLIWVRTTMPELAVCLPIPATISVAENTLRIHAKRERSITPDLDEEPELGSHLSMLLFSLVARSIARDEKQELQFDKSEIVGAEIFLMPDVLDEADWRWVRLSDLSYAIIIHRDPLEVVPFFESAFVALKSYWLKALAKGLKEQLGLKPEITGETRQTRERRLLTTSGQPETLWNRRTSTP